MKPRVVLASRSPRRKEILKAAGIPFVVRVRPIREVREPGEDPRAYVMRLAQEKGLAVKRLPEEIVLGADTVVVVDGQVLEKPSDAADATRMLKMLSGRDHHVLTGICLRTERQGAIDVATTKVRFAQLSDGEIAGYVASGEPMDKAGAYAIQGLASRFIDSIEGEYSNVVGLPIALVYRHLKEFGFFKCDPKD